MSWDWVPFATTAVASVATVGVAYLGFRHAERLASQRNQHEQQLASDARAQQRLGDAYIELLELVHSVGQWSDLVRPMIDTVPPQAPPPLPSLVQQARVEALIEAFASDTVRALMTSWREVITKVRVADRMIGFALQDRGSGLDVGEHWVRLDTEWRPAERAARAALGQQVAIELGHRSMGSP